MRIDKRKNYYCVIDVETANALAQPLCYDIGFAIVDTQGNVYKKYSYIVQEIFWDEKKRYQNPKLMSSAYYAEKLPAYYKGIFETKTFQCKPINYIRAVLQNECKRFNVKAICAYNAWFDDRALRNTIRYVTKSKTAEFLPSDIPVNCIWHMACQTICDTYKYAKWCKDNEKYSEANNCMTSAEVVYAYLKDSLDFEESHTGLEDVLIETEIMSTCLKSHKKIDRNIKSMPWKIPQAKFHKVLDI